MLHCGLNTEQQIIEEDAIWEWTKLFTEIVSVVSISNEKDNASAGHADENDFFAEPVRARNKANNTRRLDALAESVNMNNQQQLVALTGRRGSNEIEERTSQPPQSSRVSTSRNQSRNRRKNDEEEFFSMN